MSFSGTPLGQGRRLDHDTFLGKPPSASNIFTGPPHLFPSSHTYGTSTLGPRSPPKNSSPVRESSNQAPYPNDDQESAVSRFRKLKALEQASSRQQQASESFHSTSLNPEKWSVHDTSVNIATAFNQAAQNMPPNSNPNYSWTSGSSKPRVPRSTSVEYEHDAVLAGKQGALPPPLSRFGSSAQKPNSRSTVIRGKSPMLQMVESVLKPASYFMAAKEPVEAATGSHPVDEADGSESYNYSAEEQVYQADRAKRITPRRSGISMDNKAYQPSEDGYSSDDVSDYKSSRRKKGTAAERLNKLPVIKEDKRRKKRVKNAKDARVVPAEASDADEQSFSDTNSQSGHHSQSSSRSSNPAPVPPDTMSLEAVSSPDHSIDIAKQGLDTIPEGGEEMYSGNQGHEQKQRVSTPSTSRSFSIGALLGKLVNMVLSLIGRILLWVLEIICMLFYISGRVAGTGYETIVHRPMKWISFAVSGRARPWFKYIALVLILSGAWHALPDKKLRSYLPTLSMPSSKPPVFVPTEVPAANIAELAERLQHLESLLVGIYADAERSRVRAEEGVRQHDELVGRIGVLESGVVAESKRRTEADVRATKAITGDIESVKHGLDHLETLFKIQQAEKSKSRESERSSGDQEARSRLKLLEARVGDVESDVKQALELSKVPAYVSTPPTGAALPEWWRNGAFDSSRTSASMDGKDVTTLISGLVDAAVSTFAKDTIARPDFALHSGGARIIPSLTSPTYEIRPSTLRGQLLGLVTGNGYAIGRPPVTALHHELHNGHCWPFKGTEGQLGVVLSAPVYIDSVTVDHVARETAFSMESAPQHMEVWGMIEGQDNFAKLNAWKERKNAERVAAGEAEISSSATELVDYQPSYPASLPRNPPYLRIANFTYDIHATHNVQTFPADPEIQALGIDFGIVVLRVLSNWGRSEFTCLYRFRVHGQRMEENSPQFTDNKS